MKHVVLVSDMKLSSSEGDTIVTYALGSCVGIAIYDPVVHVGGMLHFMLPESKIDKSKAELNPYIFGDTGIPKLFKEAYKLGAKKKRMRVVMAGGAKVLDTNDRFNVGRRNVIIAKKLFWKNNIMISAENTGNSISRTLYLEMGSGNTWFTTGRKKVDL